MALQIPYTVLDAFTSTAFSGNPAGVIIFDADSASNVSTTIQQKIAMELNLPMTAFLTQKSTLPRVYSVRWFTPSTEAAICGHATLASSSMLFSESNELDTIRFDGALSGVILIAKKLPSGKVELALPASSIGVASIAEESLAADVLFEAFGGPVGIKAVRPSSYFLLVHVDPEFDLESATVNANVFLKLQPYAMIIVTSDRKVSTAPDARFISRVFAPSKGLAEDPVCGAAHTVLVPYWSQLLDVPSGEAIETRQVSPRGGDIEVVWDQADGKVLLRGDAVKTLKGTIFV